MTNRFINKNLISGLILCSTILPAQEIVNINPSMHYQTLRGWGVSLSWWAHDVGDKFTDKDLDVFCYWLTGPDELNMNIFRYNISGGDAPDHTHMRPDAQIPGYKTAGHVPYNWKNDSAQQKLLLKVSHMRPDAVYEAANYSPPYWMTKSGCSAGDSLGQDNLKEDHYDDFAAYLCNCVKYYKEKLNITFSTISPVNEPFSDWWKAGGKQEGCAFSQQNQEKIIRELYGQLKQNGMLSYTGIAVMDANSIDECLKGLEGYEKTGILPMIKQVNVHSYAGSKRTALHNLTAKHGIPLWQSESGPLGIKEKGWDNFLFMAKRIVTDMRELKPEVWCDWQYMGRGFGGVWSLVGYNLKDNTYERTKGFYCRKQFTSLIRQGYTFVENDNENVLTAISPDRKTMVVVMVNQEDTAKRYTLNLSKQQFKKIDLYRTSATEDFVSLPHQIKSGTSGITIDLKEKSVTSVILSGNITYKN